MDDALVSRFFTEDDPKARKVVLELPLGDAWHSRPYEYSWAIGFARPDDCVLDAACGVSHPLKFQLLDSCREVHACDLDERVLSREEILREVSEVYGEDAARTFPARYLEDIHYAKASLTALPYEDATFDTVFCISTLEHLSDVCKQRLWLAGIAPLLGPLLPRDCYLALREFRRVVKPGGRLVLTFDHPRVEPAYVQRIARRLGLEFAGDVCFDIPALAITSEILGIRCFRAVLERPGT